MVHQHFMLVPVFDVVEAVALGAETVQRPARDVRSCRGAEADRRAVRRSTSSTSNPDAKIESLPVGVRQRVEILKALYRKSDILVLDEPSAVLTPYETEELFAIIRSLTATGTTVIFITHKLNEVLEVADQIVVLRRGRVAGTADPKTTTRQELANLMVGRDVELIVPKGPAKPGEVVLSLQRRSRCATTGWRWRSTASTSTSGPARSSSSPGVQGNGQTELVEAIVGLRTIDSGEMTIGGQHIEKSTPARGLRPRRRPHPRGPGPGRADQLHDDRRELHPRHVPPRAVQQARHLRPQGGQRAGPPRA